MTSSAKGLKGMVLFAALAGFGMAAGDAKAGHCGPVGYGYAAPIVYAPPICAPVVYAPSPVYYAPGPIAYPAPVYYDCGPRPFYPRSRGFGFSFNYSSGPRYYGGRHFGGGFYRGGGRRCR